MNKKYFKGGEINKLSKLLSSEYGDKWIHFSNEDSFEFRLIRQIKHYGFKPKGMWLSKGNDWLKTMEWISSEESFIDWVAYYKSAWDVRVNMDKIKVLKNETDYIYFTQKYLKTDGKYKIIDWFEVAKSYAGIYVVNPMVFKNVSPILDWLYGWDVSSICVWNEDGILDYNKIYQARQYSKGGIVDEDLENALQQVSDVLDKERWETEEVCFIGKPDVKRESKGLLYQQKGYKERQKECAEKGVQFFLTGEYPAVSLYLFEISIPMWNFYNYMNRYNVSKKDCKEYLSQAVKYFNEPHNEIAHRDFCQGGNAFNKFAECEYKSEVVEDENGYQKTIKTIDENYTPITYSKGDKYEIDNSLPIPIQFYSIGFKESDKENDRGYKRQLRSYASYVFAPSKESVKETMNVLELEPLLYKGMYWINEINLVPNHRGDIKNGESWGSRFRELKTDLMFPQFKVDEESFHFNTLMHELAHCVDMQFQVRQATKESLFAEGELRWKPTTTHEIPFLDALYRVLKASASGGIPITQNIEYRGRKIEKMLKGAFGDSILKERVMKAKRKKDVQKAEQVREGERFGWNIGWNKTLKQFIIDNSDEELVNKLKVKKTNLNLTQTLLIYSLIKKYKYGKMRLDIRKNPKNAKAISKAVDEHLLEITRLLNNQFENVKNSNEYDVGNNRLDREIVESCGDEKTLTDFVECAIKSIGSPQVSESMKKGGTTKTWKQKYNKKYGHEKGKSHNLSQISKDTGVSKKGLQQIYNKGIGAYKTNPSSVRPNVKSKEQWAMARVYSAVMGGKASKIDKKELQMERGGETKNYYINQYGVKTSKKLDRIKDLAWDYMYNGKGNWVKKMNTIKMYKLYDRFDKEAERIGGVDYTLADSLA